MLGTDHVDPIPDEPNLVLHAGDGRALEPGERRRAPVGTVRSAVIPRRRQATDVPLAAVVVRRHRRVVQEGEQLVAVLVQPLLDPRAVGMTRPGPQHQVVEPLDQPPVGFAEGGAVEFLPVLGQQNGLLKQLDQRLNERPPRCVIVNREGTESE